MHAISIQSGITTSHRYNVSVKDQYGVVVSNSDLSPCGLYLVIPCDDDAAATTTTVNRYRVTRHATHHLYIAYGTGKEKIARINSTVALYTGQTEQCVMIQNLPVYWISEYTDQSALEVVMASGRVKTTRNDAGEARLCATLEAKSATYRRKPVRNLFLEYFTYENGYTRTTRVETKFKSTCNVSLDSLADL